MADTTRVELQAELAVRRADLWPLLATAEGVGRWLDEAEFEPKPGAPCRFRLREAVAVGEVAAVDAPQHISFRWDWQDEPLGVPTVVAIDAIDHGQRTHLTLRHVGFRSARQHELHEALWRYWFERLRRAAEALGVAAGSA
ncbi:MAG TPA: SRPBCC domain-containing protein [Candidatus Limnocylindrales bacterium]|nr:SRPBCC domain-containing protein [Candidatus Limnocylindrales bacterium]